jgi:RNA polymerase sigma factor (sigma-70 family)
MLMINIAKDNSLNQIDIDSLYTQYIDDLYAYGLSLSFDKDTCLDAIHDVFYKICLNQSRLKNIENFKFYLLKSLRNRLLNIDRANIKYREYTIEEISNELPFQTQLTIEEDYILTEEDKANLKKVQNIMDSLTHRQREIIYLRYLQDVSYEEISDIMGISVQSCRKMVYKTLTKLRKTHTILLVAFHILYQNS